MLRSGERAEALAARTLCSGVVRPGAVAVEALEVGEFMSCDVAHNPEEGFQVLQGAAVVSHLEEAVRLDSAHDVLDAVAGGLLHIVEELLGPC